MMGGRAYYVSLDSGERSMYSLSSRWSIAFLISGTLGVNFVYNSSTGALIHGNEYRSVAGRAEESLQRAAM